MFGVDALNALLIDPRYADFRNILDIGSGPGLHADHMRQAGKLVYTVDVNPDYRADFQCDFMDLNIHPAGRYDAVWCCHVLEHVPNVQLFLQRVHLLLAKDGVFAVTVPPAKHEIVGGHLSIWNAGLLLYNLVRAGFDCSEASVKQYGYNISVIVRKTAIKLPPLRHDSGDLDTLRAFFPPSAQGERFDGNIERLNW